MRQWRGLPLPDSRRTVWVMAFPVRSVAEMGSLGWFPFLFSMMHTSQVSSCSGAAGPALTSGRELRQALKGIALLTLYTCDRGVHYCSPGDVGKVELGPGARAVSCCPRSRPSRKEGCWRWNCALCAREGGLLGSRVPHSLPRGFGQAALKGSPACRKPVLAVRGERAPQVQALGFC